MGRLRLQLRLKGDEFQLRLKGAFAIKVAMPQTIWAIGQRNAFKVACAKFN
jgi:hypothetical protein